MLPHLAGRPLILRRYPDGIGVDGFVQQNASDYFSGWLHIVEVPQRSGSGMVNHVVCDDAATLVYLADQATLEFHVWLSTLNKLYYPDRLVIDIDPPEGVPVPTLRAVARQVRELFVNQVVAPLNRSADFRFVRDLASDLSDHLADRSANLLTTAQREQRRGDRIFLDLNRNAYGQSVIAPDEHAGSPAAARRKLDDLISR